MTRLQFNTDTDHTFHIPVMGTGFTLETPLRVARFGISSVVSLVDDILIDQLRRELCKGWQIDCPHVDPNDPDARARRITLFLDLLAEQLAGQMDRLRTQPFQPGTDLWRCFELLPPCPRRAAFERMCALPEGAERTTLERDLRSSLPVGNIDVNIMTKLDCALYRDGQRLDRVYNDAMAALRGFARSSLHSNMVLSAGINAPLYTYISAFPEFFPGENGVPAKGITLKVSDYRSALVQGKFLARHGIPVSEFRIESGLNCGGHAFPTTGLLMADILAEFRDKREELRSTLQAVCNKALRARGRPDWSSDAPMRVTFQGGVATAREHALLLDAFQLDSVGWGTPFLLAPDVVAMDRDHLARLCIAEPPDISLSNNSPLNVPYWTLLTCESEVTKRRRIAQEKPGSPCRKHYLEFNTEYGEPPICSASRAYQRRKLSHLVEHTRNAAERLSLESDVLCKSCICHDLGGTLGIVRGFEADAAPAICCGPGVAYFRRPTSLDEMIDHIYGRRALPIHPSRPSVFLQELRLYMDHARSLAAARDGADLPVYAERFSLTVANLRRGIASIRNLLESRDAGVAAAEKEEMERLDRELQTIDLAEATAVI